MQLFVLLYVIFITVLFDILFPCRLQLHFSIALLYFLPSLSFLCYYNFSYSIFIFILSLIPLLYSTFSHSLSSLSIFPYSTLLNVSLLFLIPSLSLLSHSTLSIPLFHFPAPARPIPFYHFHFNIYPLSSPPLPLILSYPFSPFTPLPYTSLSATLLPYLPTSYPILSFSPFTQLSSPSIHLSLPPS